MMSVEEVVGLEARSLPPSLAPIMILDSTPTLRRLLALRWLCSNAWLYNYRYAFF